LPPLTVLPLPDDGFRGLRIRKMLLPGAPESLR